MSICKDDFTFRVKVEMLNRGKTVTQLAKDLRLSRNAVSAAINHPVLPTVRRRIQESFLNSKNGAVR
jgi:hypothetical protein